MPPGRLRREKSSSDANFFETFLCEKGKLFYLCSAKAKWWMQLSRLELHPPFCFCAAKAKWWMQLSRLERRIVVPKVVGSRPIFHPLKRRIGIQFSVFHFLLPGLIGSYFGSTCFLLDTTFSREPKYSIRMGLYSCAVFFVRIRIMSIFTQSLTKRCF